MSISWPLTMIVYNAAQRQAALDFVSEDGILEPRALANGTEWVDGIEVLSDPAFASLTWLQDLPRRGIYPNQTDFPGHSLGEYFMVQQESVVAGPEDI